MDKFTVDLDQVLNDFEYSELTDQCNTVNVASAPVSDNASMHSINNVFHSLNEYLNTDIDGTVYNQNHITAGKENIDLSRQFKEFVDDSGSFIEKHESNEKFVPSAEEIITVEETIKDKSKDMLHEENSEYNEHCENEEEIEKIKVAYGELVMISDDQKTLHVHNAKIDGKESGETECIVQEIPPVSKESNENFEDVKVVENLEVNERIDPVLLDSVVKVAENNIVPANNPIDIPAIGFVDDLNLDDTEINQLLDELDKEFKNAIDSDEKTEIQLVDKDHVDIVLEDQRNCSSHSVIQSQLVEVGEDMASETNISDDLKLNEIVNKNTHLMDDEIEDYTSINPQISSETVVGNSNEVTITDLSKNDIEAEILEKDESIKTDKLKSDLKPNNEDSNTDVTIKNDDTETDEITISPSVIPNPVEDDCADTNKTENAKSIIDTGNSISDKQEIDDSGDSTSRPQNLSLKESDEHSQRQINLIGNPGSTPYNNVYVREEIHKHGTNHDSDASSESFSDEDSTASTASTEEVKDERYLSIEDDLNSCAKVGKEEASCGENTNGNDSAGSSSDVRMSGDGEVEHGAERDDAKNTQSPAEGGDMPEGPQPESAALACSSASVDYLLENVGNDWLGKRAPLWIPDADTTSCLHCDMKFTVLKRRHHCRACGLVLCAKCCHLRFKLDYLDAEARVCNKCHDILNRDYNSSSSSERTPDDGNSPLNRPNPNNPLEYCSTVPPLEQAVGGNVSVPAVMVPVGVLKHKGSSKGKSNKSVMFCDGIRPGSDLTNLDNDFNYNNTKTRKLEKINISAGKINRNLPIIDSDTNTFIPKNENGLPPIVTISKTDISYADCSNNPTIIEMLKKNVVTFAIQLSLYVHVKIIDMNCCVNKMAWCFSTEGLINVGQDELVYLLEYIDEEPLVPKDLFYHINNIYIDAVKGTSVKELGLSLHNTTNFLDSKNHAGFVYITPSFQCLENVIKPNDPFLIGILIHRWETPWAKLFPLRLILRLGAEYRYYPSPIISSRHRDSVFVEIGHTIINLLADFRNYSYSLPQIRGLTIHMEDKNTTVTIPMNRYDQVVKSLNNTSDHILAFAGTFSQMADSHLVCIQDTQGNDNSYSTHAINIHNKPRKVTGASFIVFNGALKSSSGLTAKSTIVEDGLMIQVLPEHMQQIRDKLRAMKNHTISCGCVNADSDETVNIIWGENDANFNIGVLSTVDNMSLSGIPSIRVHNGKNYVCANGNRIIRWTEVFIIQNGEENPKNEDPVDISRLSENIARATCDALVNYLDLLLTNNFQKIGIRTTLQADNVSYCAGSNGVKLPPIYMRSLDNELIPVLHRLTSANLGENTIVLELIFRILNV